MRTKIDKGFYKWGEIVIRFRYPFVIGFLLLVIFFASQIPKLTFNTSNESFFKKDNPTLIAYNEFKEQFGRDDVIIVMVESENLFTLENLSKIKKLHNEIEDTVPLVNDINSLANARVTRGEEGALIVNDLLEEMPETPEEVAKLKEYVLAHPVYRNFIISEDGKLTIFAVETDAFSALDADGNAIAAEGTGFAETLNSGPPAKRATITDKENTAIVFAVKELIAKYSSPDFKLYYSGTPVVTTYLKGAMKKDMGRFTLMAIGAIAIFLFILFQRFTGVILPLLTVIFSVIITLGTMSLSNTPITVVIQILPSFLLAVGIGASVHMMSMFYVDFRKDQGNKFQAIKDTLAHSGMPIAMTSLTTAAGLASFSAAEIAPIGDLGFFAAYGVMVCLFLTVTFIPAVLAVGFSRSLKIYDHPDRTSFVDRALQGFGHVGTKKPGLVLIVFLLILAFTITGLPQLKLAHNILKWFPAESSIRMDTEKLDARMKGAASLEVIVDTGKENGNYDPAILNGLAQLETFATTELLRDGEPFVGKTNSLATMIKEINQALNENKKEHYIIPDNNNLISQEFLLFENSGSDDLENVTDSQFRKSRLTAKTEWIDSNSYRDQIVLLQKKADEIFEGLADVSITGTVVLFAQTITIMINSMISSYIIAGVVIAIMMILLLGNLKTGLNLLPIAFTLGFMGWVGIPLDMFTLLIGSIAIGLAVDDTIHFFHNFRKYYEESHSAQIAVEKTLQTAGRAMLVTTLVLITGFMLFTRASMNNMINFGLLTSLTMLLAFLADVLLAPALLTLMTRKGGKL